MRLAPSVFLLLRTLTPIRLSRCKRRARRLNACQDTQHSARSTCLVYFQMNGQKEKEGKTGSLYDDWDIIWLGIVLDDDLFLYRLPLGVTHAHRQPGVTVAVLYVRESAWLRNIDEDIRNPYIIILSTHATCFNIKLPAHLVNDTCVSTPQMKQMWKEMLPIVLRRPEICFSFASHMIWIRWWRRTVFIFGTSLWDVRHRRQLKITEDCVQHLTVRGMKSKDQIARQDDEKSPISVLFLPRRFGGRVPHSRRGWRDHYK